MATVYELAREVRHRLVSKETGCLTVEFPDSSVSIQISDGTVAADRSVLLACFARNPVDFQFTPLKSRKSGQYVPGASLLIEAIEAIEQDNLIRIWEPYADWRILFRLDESLHNTFVKQHLSTDAEVLRRLMRLAVSGTATLQRPTLLISEEMQRIQEAYAAGNWHRVLGVGHKSEKSEIKQAYRKLARRFHPDRWVTSPDMRHRDRIEKTFQNVSHAYVALYRPRLARPQLLLGPKPKKSLWEKVSGLVR